MLAKQSSTMVPSCLRQRTFLPAGLPLGRREFLRVGGGLAVAGFLAPTVVEANTPTGPKRRSVGARCCILVYLRGGPPHLDMWDLKPSAPATSSRPSCSMPQPD